MADLKAILEALESRQSAEESLNRKEKRKRTVARLAMVQALYQLEITSGGVESVIKEFVEHRFDGDIDGAILAEADEVYFSEALRGVVTNQGVIDPMIIDNLASGWRLERLDATLRAITRAGAWEMVYQPSTPVEVIIDEYVELTRAFFDEQESRFINGVLDAIAKQCRHA
jgi:N utilization substance protein B